MIQSFRDPDTKLLFDGRGVARFANIAAVAVRKLQQVHAATNLDFLRVPPGNRLEANAPLVVDTNAVLSSTVTA